ncbi:pentatricopeptide repeat-containing protein At2g02750 [Zingiber officinale]|uniref:pentatricopeptide repeat-containing protein At2g02750 n=1 Tax=Zingiber officinale TaxID=94328 RepID=UPI001C4AE4B3|nr:pentatricopeptide repeat-containing protein At2g02750 [Zingiber officinale]
MASGKLHSVLITHILHGHATTCSIHSATALSTAYRQSGYFHDAFKVFDRVHHPTLQSFKALIPGLSRRQYFHHLLPVFTGLLDNANLHPSSVNLASLLRACATPKQAKQLHGLSLKMGHDSDAYIVTSLITKYSNCSELSSARRVFELMRQKKVATFNAMLSALVRNAEFLSALKLFRDMVVVLRPSSVTVASLLPACTTLMLGKQLHVFSLKVGHDSDAYVATALLTMYSNCSELSFARRIFQLMLDKKVATFNAMLSALVRNAEFLSALNLFREMLVVLQSNSSTLLTVLSACSELSSLRFGKQIHCYVFRNGLSYHDVKIGTALVRMYCKCSLVEQAHRVFQQMEDRNLVTWNTMISGFLCHGDVHSALSLFHQLRVERISPDAVTWNILISGLLRHGNVTEAYRLLVLVRLDQVTPSLSLECMTSLLQVSSSTSNLLFGKEIHCHALRIGVGRKDDIFQTALIDMYMKCGYSLHACRVFNHVESKSMDPVMWNAMISGYGRNGEHNAALELFREMLEHEVKPSAASFLASLSACSHSGQVEKGMKIFKFMTVVCGIKPSKEHLGCLIDLLGRAGKLSEAEKFICEIPEPSSSMYSSLLGASRHYAEAELGKAMSKKFYKLEPRNSTSLVILSNIYAKQGKWEEVEKVREKMMSKEIYKMPGHAWVVP